MKLSRLISIFVALIFCAPALADDAPSWSGSYDQWKSALDEAEKRVGEIESHSAGHGSQVLHDALNRANASKYDIEHLASSLRSRQSDIDSAEFHTKMAKEDFESAKRQADQLSEQIDAKAAQLRSDVERAKTESARLNDEGERLHQWSTRLDEWHARIEANRRVFQLPDEQPALDAFNADVAAFNADAAKYNAELATQKDDASKFNTWRDQLLEIEKLITEDGKQVLELRAKESKKEQEYVEAKGKLDKFTETQDQETASLMAFLGPSLAQLQGLVAALDAPAPAVTFSGAASGGAYAVRDDDDSAQAVSVAAPEPNAQGSGQLRDRIFILPTSDSNVENVAADTARRQLSAQMNANAMVSQYRPIPAGQAPPPATVDSTRSVVAFESRLAATSNDSVDRNSVLRLSDDDLAEPLDPRSRITRQEYLAAMTARNRLNDLLPKLQDRLEKLRKEREKTLDYQAEFEEIRAETVRGAIRDTLSVLPVSGILQRLAKNPALAATLTPEAIQRVELAMKVVRMEVGREHAQKTAGYEKTRQEAEVAELGAEALLSMVAGKMPEESADRLLVEQVGKMLKVQADFGLYLADPQAGKRPNWEEAGEVAKFGIGAAGLFCAPVALGAGLESLGERGVSAVIIRSAMQDLSSSLKSNYDAERFLQEKIDRTKGFVEELDRTVDGYEAIKSAAHKSVHVHGEDS